MSVRERVQRAIEGPVTDAERLVDAAEHADDHTKLSLQLNGWFRGIAAALEELAVELDVLREEREEDRRSPAGQAAARVSDEAGESPAAEGVAPAADERLDEEALAERARMSRAETEELRGGGR